MALLARTDSIRDVIAFPKSGGGFDPLTAAPAPITPEQRKEAGVDAVPEKAAWPNPTGREPLDPRIRRSEGRTTRKSVDRTDLARSR